MNGRFTVSAIFTAVDNWARPIARMQTRLQAFGTRAQFALRGIDRMNRSVIAGFRTAGIGLAALALPVAAVGASILRTGSDFEQAITNVGAVGLQTRDQIADLEKRARELGATTKFTATEAANAMEVMARAGFKNEEILAGVDGVLSAAAASGLEMSEVANVVSNTLKGMGLAASDAAKVADVLALASSRTNSTIGTLGESMKNLAPVARQLGVPLEEAVASVALLQDVGLDASEAGTATATMLTKLTKPIPEVAKKMKDLGIAFKDAQGNALPLPQILGQFDKAAKKSGGNMEVVAFFADLVGLRGQKAALNLKDLFASGKLSSLTKELKGAAGSAEKMADIRMDTLQGDWTLLKSAVDGVKVKLFDLQGGPLRGVVQRTTEWVTANQDLIATRAEEWIKKISDNLPKIVKWSKRIGIAVGIFVAWTVAIKAAQVAIGIYQGTVALVGGVTNLLTSETLRNTIVTGASTTARGIATAATWAWNAALAIGRIGQMRLTVATVANTVATNVSKIAIAVRTGAMWLATTASGAFTAGTASLTTATIAGTAATKGATMALAPFAAAMAAAAAAAAALYLAWDQLNKLNKETEGLGLGGIVSGMVDQGTLDPFAVVDAHQNKLAKERAAKRAAKRAAGSQVVSEGDMVSQSIAEKITKEQVDLFLHMPDGAKVEVKRGGKKGSGLRMPRTGAD